MADRVCVLAMQVEGVSGVMGAIACTCCISTVGPTPFSLPRCLFVF